MRITHNRKKQLARHMRTKQEVKFKVPVFQTAAWEKRATDRRLKPERQTEKRLLRQE